MIFSLPLPRRLVGAGVVCAVALVAASGLWLRAGDDGKTATPPARKPWTTSKVVGSPEPPPPYKTVRVFPNVRFTNPLVMAFAPGSDRFFVGEELGKLFSVANKPDAKAEPFFDLKKDLRTVSATPGAKGVDRLYGLVFHPKFEQNRYCYLCYTMEAADKKVRNLPEGSRVSRFKVTATDPPRLDPASEEIVLTFLEGGHNGGDLHFGPDGMLYISTGDAANPNPPDRHTTGQDCSDLLSSILRIDVDHKGEPEGVSPRRNYSIPKDNPFVALPGVKPEIWAFGFRNPWRMGFDRQTGDLWVGDVGWELWEMIHKIRKGGNYGWSIVEGRQPVRPDQKVGPTPILPPTIELPHTISMSVTGGRVYRGKKFPDLVGSYIFGDWETRRLWGAKFDGDQLKEMPELVKPTHRVVAFGEDHASELYYLDHDGGMIYTLERNDAAGQNTNFPKSLSQTGVFASVKDQTPADGVVAFSPNARQWQDGATAEWYAALPGTSSVTVFDKPRPLPIFVSWHSFRTEFPKDAVLVKTISLPVAGEKTPRRVETQLLHFDGLDWYGYSYAWRDDQTDADLVPTDGTEKLFTVADDRVPGGKREQAWVFHSRTQCISCHSNWSEFALAFNPGQLNGPGVAAGGGGNQLLTLNHAGYIRRIGEKDNVLPLYDAATVAKEVVIENPHDASKPLDRRARAYLHANCAHCHRFGGGGGQVVLELDATRTLEEMMAIDVRPRQGDFGLPDPRVIAPGHPERSVLYYRMAKFGRGRMPHLGSEYPDPFAVELVNEWICSLGKQPYTKPPADAKGADAALQSPATALPIARGIGSRTIPGADRQRVIAQAEKLPAGPVRDLFDGYLPPDPKGRKLGTSPRPAAILGLTGDAKKGEAVFFTESMQCAKCHKVGERGGAVGPELTAIGKTRPRAELLDSILHPSAKIDAQFAAYLVKTVDGRSFTGLLVKRDDKQVIVRDVEGKDIVLPAGDVEAVQPSRLSLMPEGLVAGLTPQEAADLLEFLTSRK